MSESTRPEIAYPPRWDSDGELIDSPGWRDLHRHVVALYVLAVVGALGAVALARMGFGHGWWGVFASQGAFFAVMLGPGFWLRRAYRIRGYPVLGLTAASYVFMLAGFAPRKLPVYTEYRTLRGYPNAILGTIKLALDIERTGAPVAPEDDTYVAEPDTSSGVRWREFDLGEGPGLRDYSWQAMATFMLPALPYGIMWAHSRLFGGINLPYFVLLAPAFLAPVLICAPAFWVRATLRSKGYPTITFDGALFIFAHLGYRFRRIPRYEDFSMVPGYRNSINGVLDLMRDMQARRKG